MDMILIVAVLMFIALIGLKLLASKAGTAPREADSLGYRQKKTLFTPAERSFLGVLDQCIDKENHRIFGKVRVADLIEPNPSRNRSEWQRAFNAISAKHFDFVICTADTLQPVCAIELDDSSHSQKKRQQRDQLLEGICKEANFFLIRVPAKRSYKPEEGKAMLSEVGLATSTAAPASVGNAASQLLGKNKKKMLSDPENLEVDDVHIDDIGGAVR